MGCEKKNACGVLVTGEENQEKEGLDENRESRAKLPHISSYALEGRLDKGLPLDRSDSNHPCPGPRIHKPKGHSDSRQYKEAQQPNSCIRSGDRCNNPPANYPAPARTTHLLCPLPSHHPPARPNTSHSLFAHR